MTPEQNEKFKTWAINYAGLKGEQMECKHKQFIHGTYTKLCSICFIEYETAHCLLVAKAAWIAAIESEKNEN